MEQETDTGQLETIRAFVYWAVVLINVSVLCAIVFLSFVGLNFAQGTESEIQVIQAKLDHAIKMLEAQQAGN